MKRLRELQFYPDGFPTVGLLFLRIFAGYGLAQHGLDKLASPFGWLDSMNTGTPGILQALAAISEFFGGIALIFGILTPLACLAIMCTMFVATMFLFGKGATMVANPPNPSWELSGLYFVIALTLFLTGPGLLSFDYFVFGRKKAAPTAT